VHVAAEKPFGTSAADAEQLHGGILSAGVPEANLHLVDHWLSFFMNRKLPALRAIVQPRLGLNWDAGSVAKVVVTEFEARGLEGRGGFFDGVGQVRDMVQSHLLQVLALTLLDPAQEDVTAAKMAIFSNASVSDCSGGQYEGFLLEPKLKFHADSADATLCEVLLSVDTDAWRGVPMVIRTGKDMGTTLYTVEVFQKDGPGVLTFEIGKEETGLGGVKVRDWPLADSGELSVPGPGFPHAAPAEIRMTPAVSESGNGYIVNYSDPRLYFPKPYALMAASLLSREYEEAFVSYPECRRSWEIVTAGSPARCLDPGPGAVRVYQVPSKCGNTPPAVCWEKKTVQDVYNDTFKCTPQHDALYKNVSLYRAKCQPPARPALVLVV